MNVLADGVFVGFVDFKFIMLSYGLASQVFCEVEALSEEKIERLLKDLEKARELLRSAERRLSENYDC